MVEPSADLQVVFDKAIRDAQKLKHEYVQQCQFTQ